MSDIAAAFEENSEVSSNQIDVNAILPCDDRVGGLYPNVDISIWLRTCQEENIKPVRGKRYQYKTLTATED